MTLAKVSPGQPLRLPAEAYNAFIDAAVAHQAERLGQGGQEPVGTRPSGIITVRNDTGVSRNRGDVLTVGNPLILPSANLQAFQSRIAIRGVAPDAAKPGRFVVLQEPIPAGGMGRACIAGVTTVSIDMVNASDATAEVVTGQASALRSGPTGSALILWVEPGTGVRQAVVRLLGSSGASSASGERLEITVTQPAHGFAIGDVLYVDPNGRYGKADADILERCRVAGVVRAVPDPQTVILVLAGRVSDFLPSSSVISLVPGTTYYLRSGYPGVVTADPGLNPIPVYTTGTVVTDIIVGNQATIYRPSVVHRVRQSNHGFTVGTVIAGNASGLSFIPAIAAPGTTFWSAPVGVVCAVIDASTFAYVSHGIVSGLFSLTAYTTYYLSDVTAGLLTATPPVPILPIGVSMGGGAFFVQIQQPMRNLSVGNINQNGVLRVRGPVGNAVVIDAALVTAANRALRLREVDVCSGGLAKRMLILASDPY